jgi:hypothetical protein
MGRARLISLHKFIKHGYACVDSGATHHMLNGEATNFMNYKTLMFSSLIIILLNAWELALSFYESTAALSEDSKFYMFLL